MNAPDTRPVAVVTGATGTGKTDTAVVLARLTNGEVISADSRQVYRGVDVGTNKPEGGWRDGVYLHRGIPHHLVDFLDIRDEYSAGRFCDDARRLVDEVRRRGRSPLIVGGTGFYIAAYADGLAALPPRDRTLRQQLMTFARENGPERLHALLVQRDPQRAAAIHPHNVHRVVRALEIVLSAGMPVAELLRRLPPPQRRPVAIVGLAVGLDTLRRRIALRTRRMFASGMPEEAAALLSSGVASDAPGFTAIGYRHVLAYVRGELSREDAIELTVRDTVRYARAQLTWFRRDRRIVWFDAESGDPEALAAQLYRHFRAAGSLPGDAER